MRASRENFLHLNADNRWSGFQWEGLELRPDGALQLFSLPRVDGVWKADINSFVAATALKLLPLIEPSVPAGIVTDWDGTIYASDPTTHRVWRIFDREPVEAVPIPDSLRSPRGLWIDQDKRRLFVADTRNHRIVVITLTSASSSSVIQGDDQFEPWALAGDHHGNLYVVDGGNRTVQKFDANGVVIDEFWKLLKDTELVTRPVAIALGNSAALPLVFLLDAAASKIFVFDTDGRAVLNNAGQPLAFGGTVLSSAQAVAAAGDTVYVGSNINATGRVLAFKRKDDGYVLAGEALSYLGPVAALAHDGKGHLLVHAGTLDNGLVRLSLDQAFRSQGILWSKPIEVGEIPTHWHRVIAHVDGVGPHSHLQFFLHTSDVETSGSPNPEHATPFPGPPWRSMPIDVTDLFIGGAPAKFLRVGAQVLSDATSSPRLSQIRVEFNHDSYLGELPEIYRADGQPGNFTLRLLSLIESLLDELETDIANLPAWFEPSNTSSAALSLVAGWLGLPLRDDFVRRDNESTESFEARKVYSNARFLRAAIPLIPYRGTLLGLEALLREWLRDDLAEADRPILSDANTTFQLAPAKDDDRYPGEVYAQVGLTTVFGEPWPPFFFCVDLTLDPAVRELHRPAGIQICGRAARFLIDQEKPAHCTYELRIHAQYGTMRLAPAKRLDWRPEEIYARVAETTLL